MPPNCSLDDIDLSALKVSEICASISTCESGLSKEKKKKRVSLAIEYEMKSFHEIPFNDRNTIGVVGIFFSLVLLAVVVQ